MPNSELTPLPTWAVAAAILIQDGGELHYNEITSRVLASKLTGLAWKGKTPEQSIGASLRAHEHIFGMTGQGYYRLRAAQRASEMPEVREAIAALKAKVTAVPLAGRAEVERLTAENARLRQRIEGLEKQLREALPRR